MRYNVDVTINTTYVVEVEAEYEKEAEHIVLQQAGNFPKTEEPIFWIVDESVDDVHINIVERLEEE